LIALVRIIYEKVGINKDIIQFNEMVLHSFQSMIIQSSTTAGVIIILELLYLIWWGFSFSFAEFIWTKQSSNTGEVSIYDFTVIRAILLLNLLWTLSVFRSLVLSSVGSTISGWYRSIGHVPPSSFRNDALQNAFSYNFGSVVFASIFVDIVGVLSWFLRFIHRFLIYPFYTDENSLLVHIANKIESKANFEAYSIMLTDDLPFLESSQEGFYAPYPSVTTATPSGTDVSSPTNVRRPSLIGTSNPRNNSSEENTAMINCGTLSTSLAFSGVFIALQAFCLVLTGTNDLVAAIIAFFISLTLVSAVIHGFIVALLASYRRDPLYLESTYGNILSQIQKLHQQAAQGNRSDYATIPDNEEESSLDNNNQNSPPRTPRKHSANNKETLLV
jgi:hypothetical protein